MDVLSIVNKFMQERQHTVEPEDDQWWEIVEPGSSFTQVLQLCGYCITKILTTTGTVEVINLCPACSKLVNGGKH